MQLLVDHVILTLSTPTATTNGLMGGDGSPDFFCMKATPVSLTINYLPAIMNGHDVL